MSKRAWIVFLVLVVGTLVGLVSLSKSNSTSIDVSEVNGNSILSASEQSGNIADQVDGNPNSKVLLIEYGDYQCGGCAGVHTGIKSLVKDYGDKFAFVYRNFPLTDIHPNAKAAAAAAEAAGLQDKFWEMNAIIFENQSEWQGLSVNERTDQFVEYAKSLKLDEDQFVEDMASSAVTSKINFDKELGIKAGVNSTPSFYLNGEKVGSEVIRDMQTADGQLIRDLIDAKL